MLAIVSRLRIAPRFALPDDVMSRLDRECRNADFAEAEVIAAIVVTLLRLRIGLDGDVHRFRDLLHGRIESRSLRAVEHDILDPA